jgi:outer membrane autotransporter protein
VSNLTLANNSLWKMTGSSNITNLVNDPSLILYSPPTGDPHVLASYKTLTAVNYVGQGGGIGLNTFLGGDGSPSDRLVINGGTASGTSRLFIRNTTGTGALTTGNGIEVVSAINGATTAPGAFHLGNAVLGGPYEYLLFRGGVTPGAEENWFLRNESGPVPPTPPDPTPPDPGPTPDPPGPPPTPTPPTPQCLNCPTPPEPHPYYRMEAPLYSKISLLARQVGLLLLDTFHERQGDQYLLMNDDRGVWGKLIGVGLSQKFTGPLAPSFNGTVGAAQIGSDAYVWDDRHSRVGGFASYARVNGTVRGTILDDDDALGGQLPEDVLAAGGYFTHIGDNGWYLDAVLMGSWYNAYPLSERGIGTHTTGTGFSASLEGAYPWELDEEWTLEPMAQIVFTTLSFRSTSDPFTTLDFNPGDAWYGRLGARLEYDTTIADRQAKPFFELNLWHGFGGTDTTVYNGNIPVAIPYGNTDIEAAAGLTSQVSESFALSVRLGYLTSIDGNFQRAYKGQIGARYAW